LISIVILAAGLSTRFGRNKLLETIEGRPLIRRVVETALASLVDETVVVLGHQAQDVRAALEGLGCRFVYNIHYREGQSSSVKAGLKAVSRNAEATMVLPGDVALITSATINVLIREYVTRGGLLLIAAHEGKAGHPILFDQALFREMLAIEEQSFGLKAVVGRHRHEARMVEVGNEGVLYDLDTPEDFRRRIPSWKG
jgi:molybdenum cofactor cytidylyltransferase